MLPLVVTNMVQKYQIFCLQNPHTSSIQDGTLHWKVDVYFQISRFDSTIFISRGKDHRDVWSADFVAEHKFMCLKHSRPNWNLGVWSRERFVAGPCREMGGSCPPNLNSSKGFQESTLTDKVRKGHGWLLKTSCWNPSFLQLSMWSGHDVRINLWQDKCYALFCSSVSIWMDSSRSDNGLSCVSQAYKQHSFNERCRVSMTKQGKDRKVKVKRTYLICSQSCSSLL